MLIRTGELEEHITADVAWSVVRLATWSRPSGRLTDPERQLLVDTARYWASRCRHADDGSWHLEHVIGPDEYHEDVDDNVFTNVLAGWNLRTAAERCPEVPADERARWQGIAAGLPTGRVPGELRHEQFRGYDDLEPLLMADVAEPPVAADVLLGRDRVAPPRWSSSRTC